MLSGISNYQNKNGVYRVIFATSLIAVASGGFVGCQSDSDENANESGESGSEGNDEAGAIDSDTADEGMSSAGASGQMTMGAEGSGAGDSSPADDGGGESETGEDPEDSDSDAGSMDDEWGDDEMGEDEGMEDTGEETETGEEEEPEGPPPEVPDNAYCANVKDWNPGWRDFEDRVLELTNQRRAAGANCRSGGNFGPTHPVVANHILRCAARVHSKDMYERGFFSHNNPSGENPFQRMEKAGYRIMAASENIAQGQSSPEQVVNGWMGSDGHCANIMSPDVTELGVGYHAGSGSWRNGHLWTQNFGTPLKE